MDRSADIAIVGAGIVGLAHAYMALKEGYRVVMFERDEFAAGASIRNFGLLWPIGQEPSESLDRALRSRRHWDEVSAGAGIWLKANGSLHVAYHEDEFAVLNEFNSLYGNSGYTCNLMSPSEIKKIAPAVKQQDLLGGLFSATEATVYSREAIRRLPLWLQEKFGLILKFGHVVTEVSLPLIKTARETWHVEKVFICSGADFETLYPEIFDQYPVSKCKLQMMKAVTGSSILLGPSICAGLTLRHYPAFAKCPSLEKLDKRYDNTSVTYKKYGVHVLVAQNNYGEFIIGDSHHYERTHVPFDSEEVNEIILGYLATFVNLRDLKVVERWNGIYPKLQGGNNLIAEPERGVTIVTGLGGAGMTLSFGLAEEIIGKL